MKIYSKHFIGLIGAFLIFGFAHSLEAGSIGVGTDLFQKNRTRLAVTAGAGSAFQNDYIVVGAGLGYYVLNGLEFGFDAEAWWGNNPNIYKLSPQVRYVMYQFANIKPYVGTFYKRTFYEGLADLDSYGGRVGAFTQLNSRVYLGVGYVVEKYTGCNDRIYSSCTTDYPEFSLSAAF